MEIALFLVLLAVGVLTVTTLAERLDLPAPLVLVVVGAAVSYVPGMPEVVLEPEVVLFGLLPPLLYSAAISSSLVDIKAARRPILLLAVGLVAFTTVGVGALVWLLIPPLDWWAAFAIGAVVAPPDAVAATAIGRRIGLPRGIVTILEGESLFNDATALVALNTAVAAGTVAGISAGEVGLDFALAAGGGVLVGVVLYKAVAWVRSHLTDAVSDTAISLVVPFAAYVLAEEVHASGVIAVVVSGLLLGHTSPVLMSAESRIAERINFRTIAYVLENAVFLLIGLQASTIFADVGASTLSAGRIVAVCALTLLAVVVLRMAWIFASRFLLLRRRDSDTGHRPPWTYGVLLGWAGMRGVVTLAAAFVIPEGTPYREVLLLAAFTVVAGTLLLQGVTLPLLARAMRVPSPDPMQDALARATLLEKVSKAGLADLEQQEYDDPHGVVDAIRRRIDQRNFAVWEQLGTSPGEESPTDLYSRLRLSMIGAERERVLAIRSKVDDRGRAKVASEVVAEVLRMLDVEESMLDRGTAHAERLRDTEPLRPTEGYECEDLAGLPAVETSDAGYCQECREEGGSWVALRQCLTCGHLACCDSSPRRHASAHFRETLHPVMESAEPEEQWRWCFVHHVTA